MSVRGKLAGSRAAFRFAFGGAFTWRSRLKLFELFFDGRQIGVNRLVEQLRLFHGEMLGLGAKAPAPVKRELVGELLNLGLAPVKFLIFACERLILLGQQRMQFGDAQVSKIRA